MPYVADFLVAHDRAVFDCAGAIERTEARAAFCLESMPTQSEALSAKADTDFLFGAKLVVNVRCSDGAFRRSDDDLVEAANHISGRVEARDCGLLMGIDL